MKIIAVVGTGSGSGKTTVACRILRAIPGLGAVKISPRLGESRVEWGAGEPGKDTALYVDSGAVQVARIIGPRSRVLSAWEQIRGQLEECRGVVIEGASSLNIPGERYVVCVVGNTQEERFAGRCRELASLSNVIIERSSHFDQVSFISAISVFLSAPANE